MLQKLLMIAFAGALGTLARYGLSGVVQEWTGRVFPWGTVAVNVLGCLVFGMLWSAMESRVWIGGEARAVVLVGFLGGFTTFSSFVFETGQLLQDSQWLPAFGNLAIQNVAGLLALFLGLALGRLI